MVESSSPPILTWDILRGLDHDTGKVVQELDKFEGSEVGIPGFAVPIAGDSDEEITEILLVPEPMMCIHVPPPPPNQLVHVKFKTPQPVESYVPLLVSGNLEIVKTKSEYGKAGFVMEGLKISPYEIDEESYGYTFVEDEASDEISDIIEGHEELYELEIEEGDNLSY